VLCSQPLSPSFPLPLIASTSHQKVSSLFLKELPPRRRHLARQQIPLFKLLEFAFEIAPLPRGRRPKQGLDKVKKRNKCSENRDMGGRFSHDGRSVLGGGEGVKRVDIQYKAFKEGRSARLLSCVGYEGCGDVVNLIYWNRMALVWWDHEDLSLGLTFCRRLVCSRSSSSTLLVVYIDSFLEFGIKELSHHQPDSLGTTPLRSDLAPCPFLPCTLLLSSSRLFIMPLVEAAK
jgi:hypothetical protein